MHTDFQKPALSVAEFCAATTLGRTRVYEEIKHGRLKVLKCGRRTIIPVEALREWLERLALEAQSE